MNKISRRDFLRASVLGGAVMGASLTLGPGLTLAQSAKKGVWFLKYDCYIGSSQVGQPLHFDGKEFQKKIDELIRKYEPGKLRNPWEIYKMKYQ